ncbi:MAG: hypothetical protein Q8N78_07505 [Sulfurimonas sp.]|nr:hypothetical protein [Sulfurimonas sp.]
MIELRKKICNHVDLSIADTQYNEELCFPIPTKTVKRLLQILHLNIEDYICVIKSHDVRHVKKIHPKDIGYICEIPIIIQKFDRVEKSIVRCKKTGTSLVNFAFEKRYDKNTVKLVKLRVLRDKKLELKTIFVKE